TGDCAKLQLLDGSLATVEFCGDFTNTLLLREAHEEHLFLVCRQFINQAEDPGAVFERLHIRDRAEFRRILKGNFPSALLPAIGDCVGSDPQQPGAEGHASPLKALKIGERLVKHIRRQIFRNFAAGHATSNKEVHGLEVKLVKLGKARRILLGSLHQQALVWLRRGRLRCRCSNGHSSSKGIAGGPKKGYAARKLAARAEAIATATFASEICRYREKCPRSMGKAGGTALNEAEFTMQPQFADGNAHQFAACEFLFHAHLGDERHAISGYDKSLDGLKRG